MNIEQQKIIEKHYNSIIRKCISYTDASVLLENIYIYTSFEEDWWCFFNVFFKIDNVLLKKHDLSKILPTFELTDEKQKKLNRYCQAKLEVAKKALISERIGIPTEIKVIFDVRNNKADYQVSYQKQLVDNLSFHDITDRWYQNIRCEIE